MVMGAVVMGFLDRVGGVLVAPRRTLAGVVEGKGGLGDVAVLMVLRLLAEQMDVLARAVLGFSMLGARGLMAGIAGAASPLLPELLGILLGAVVIALAPGKLMKGARGRELDIAGFAWVPFLAVRMVGALVFTGLGRAPVRGEEYAIDGIALAWAGGVLALGILAAQGRGSGSENAKKPEAPPAGDVTEK